jgi:hypothetical protein
MRFTSSSATVEIAGADLIRQRRHAQIDALAGVTIAPPVQRLMLAELLEQGHRQQVRSGKAAWSDIERRRGLHNRLAGPAGELLPHRLNNLPLARDDLKRFGDVLAQFQWLRRSAAGASFGRGDDDTFVR